MEARNKRGKRSFLLPNRPVITAWASVAGKKESEGPLNKYFDMTFQDTYFGEKTWEQAEKKMQQLALERLLTKSGLDKKDVGVVYSGDLLNQCIGSSFSLNNTGMPHVGLYGACSTMAESLMLAGMCVDGGYSDRVIAMTSSHFAGSERQYRFPLGYGGQRPPTAQWTVTGAGAAMVCSKGTGAHLDSCTVGIVKELGVKDANNMGAAMAPAAYATIKTHFDDLNVSAEDFDLIVTGDLGQTGKQLLLELARRDGFSLAGRLTDCGTLIFDQENQDVHAGGSGCGCSAVTLCGYLLEKMRIGKYKRILFCGTGALLSPTSSQQGLPIPGVCHAVSIAGGD
jgi:stage V sporulation protein AD